MLIHQMVRKGSKCGMNQNRRIAKLLSEQVEGLLKRKLNRRRRKWGSQLVYSVA